MFIKNLEQAYEKLDNSLVDLQLQLEMESSSYGRERFIKNYETAKSVGGNNFANQRGNKALVNVCIDKLSKRLDEEKERVVNTRPHKSLAFIKAMDSDKLAYLTVSVVLGQVATGKEVKVPALIAMLNKVAINEHLYGEIYKAEKGFFKQILEKGIKERVGFEYKRLFAKYTSERRGIDVDERMESPLYNDYIGVRLLELLIESTGLVTVVRQKTQKDTDTLELNEQFLEAINERVELLANFEKLYQPMVIPPKAWTYCTGGGYYSEALKIRLVRTQNPKDCVRIYKDVYMPEVMRAVNLAQNTAWQVNKKVLAVMQAMKNDKNPIKGIPSIEILPPEKPFDIDTNEESLKKWKKDCVKFYQKKKSIIGKRLRFDTTLDQAEKFSKYEKIYFPYNLDWRGRMYPVTTFSPQSDDIGKALLVFAEKKPVGIDGFQWIKIHLANTAGVDKVSFEERVAWVEKNHDHIMASADDPLHYLWWAEQDKTSFQLLAACFEYAEIVKNGVSYKSGLAVAFDGSCSGNQHFACMLRDENGGRAVNLVPQSTPNDIYRVVAEEVIKQCELLAMTGSEDGQKVITKDDGSIVEVTKYGTKTMAKRWLEFGITRDVTKRPTMTSCYGAAEYGFKEQVYEDTVKKAIDEERDNGLFKDAPKQFSNFMGSQIWQALQKVSVKSMEAMKWLQECADLVASPYFKDKDTILRDGSLISWATTDNFVVVQEYKETTRKRLNTMFLGHTYKPSFSVETPKIDNRKMKQGIAPNFVHSFDANHLREVVRYVYDKYGITDLALIHDSFGTHAGNATKLYKAVRETLVNIYGQIDVLEKLREVFKQYLHKDQFDDLPPVPSKGELDLNIILDSKYAFA